MEANFGEILPLLTRHEVRFIVVGGGAAIAHGSARLTSDVDVVYSRDAKNIRNLAAALENHPTQTRSRPAKGPRCTSGTSSHSRRAAPAIRTRGKPSGEDRARQLSPFGENLSTLSNRFLMAGKIVARAVSGFGWN